MTSSRSSALAFRAMLMLPPERSGAVFMAAKTAGRCSSDPPRRVPASARLLRGSIGEDAGQPLGRLTEAVGADEFEGRPAFVPASHGEDGETADGQPSVSGTHVAVDLA